jgi:hypothetical protein
MKIVEFHQLTPHENTVILAMSYKITTKGAMKKCSALANI